MNSSLLSHEAPAGFDVDFDLLWRFEEGLDPSQPEKNDIPCRVLGYGEISTVFAVDADGLRGVALKRMVLFADKTELTDYLKAYHQYHQLLVAELDISLPQHGHAAFIPDDGRPIFYIIQQQLTGGMIGNQLLHKLSHEENQKLFRRVLRHVHKTWLFNQSQDKHEVALDGQISNWALPVSDVASIDQETPLLYIDTSTPIFRIDGKEQLNVELFLRLAPSFMRWIMRRYFLDDVMSRYYDVRFIIIDLIANLIKEQKESLIPEFIEIANTFFSSEMAAARIEPIKQEEIRAYYREDALIWSLYTGMRRFDRFLHRYILRRPYIHILPGKTDR